MCSVVCVLVLCVWLCFGFGTVCVWPFLCFIVCGCGCVLYDWLFDVLVVMLCMLCGPFVVEDLMCFILCTKACGCSVCCICCYV